METRKPNILRALGIDTLFTLLFVGAIILFDKPQNPSQEFFYGLLVGMAIVLFGTIIYTTGKAFR